MKVKFVVNLFACGIALILTAGCATTVPKPQFTTEIISESQIASKDEAKVQVEAGSGVSMLESERMRVSEKIKQKINERKVNNAREVTAKNYEIKLVMTKYEKGNAFARAMLAGLGQIHIDADVTVFEMPGRNQVGGFSISKTFAWGGIYGGTTSIEDIETTFADGVAAALTGQSEDQKKTAEQTALSENTSSTVSR